MQTFKIYLGESKLILADAVPQMSEPVQAIRSHELDLEKLFHAAKNLAAPPITYLFSGANVGKIFEIIMKESNLVRAAGGLVRNGEGQYLFIHRLGKWDLPKGKIEDGEDSGEAALREVEEECGIRPDHIGPQIATTYHTYVLHGKFILKQTDWYEMAIRGTPKPVPQTEEDITEVRWFAPEDFGEVRENTYPLIAGLLSSI